MDFVFFMRIGVHQGIVNQRDRNDINLFLELVVNKGLERLGVLHDPEIHDKILQRTITSSEGGFPLFFFCNSDQIECATEIKGEERVLSGDE